MKKILLGLLLAPCSAFAMADDAIDHAIAGQSADVATTVVGITAFGAVEANPLGLGMVVVKPALVYWANSIEDPINRCRALRDVGNAGWAPAAANIATMLGVATGGAVVIAIGTFLYLQSGTAAACAGVAE